MTTTRTVLLFNLILLQLFLFNTSSASVLSSLTSRNDRDQHDEDFDFDVHNLFLMEVDELNEIQRYLNSTGRFEVLTVYVLLLPHYLFLLNESLIIFLVRFSLF